jgi:hypothetical protein
VREVPASGNGFVGELPAVRRDAEEEMARRTVDLAIKTVAARYEQRQSFD